MAWFPGARSTWAEPATGFALIPHAASSTAVSPHAITSLTRRMASQGRGSPGMRSPAGAAHPLDSRPVIAIAAFSGPFPKLGVIAVALLAGAAILNREERPRAWAMLGGLVLAPTLLLADIWSSPQLHVIHRHPIPAAIGGAVVVAALAAL